MTSPAMYGPQRHRQILDALARDGRVSVAALAEQFDVTTETIRRDLEQLASRDLLVRVHGGAVAASTTIAEPDLATRATTNVEAKTRIGIAASALLPRDASAPVLVDAGSTTAALVPHLAGRTGLVLTHGLEVASRALAVAGPPVHLLPGRLRPSTGAAVGADTVDALSRLTPEVAFLGCNGVDLDGASTPDTEEAAVKAAIVRRARRRVLLADASKFGVQHLVTFAPLDAFDALVTDSEPSADLREALTAARIEVVVA